MLMQVRLPNTALEDVADTALRFYNWTDEEG
jgi:hypothetical protein